MAADVPKTEWPRITLRIPPELRDWLAVVARGSAMDESSVARLILIAAMRRNERGVEGE